jgi:rod shape-determining protein MreC
LHFPCYSVIINITGQCFFGKANEITGYVNSKYDNVDDYFHLKEENLRIHKMNDSLLNLLPGNFIKVDTGLTVITDTVRYDTLHMLRKYLAKEAKV